MKPMKKYFLGAMALAFSVVPLCAQPKPNPKPPAPKLTASGRGAIFSAPMAREFSGQCSRESPTGWWTTVAPSLDETRRLEAALPLWMKARASEQWKGRFDAYLYQYGAIVRGGKRLIYINALPTSGPGSKDDWKRKPILVCDGGPDFWGAEFDPKKGEFQNVSYNGMI